MFEQIRWILDNMLGLNGDVFVIRDGTSSKDIKICNGVATKDEETNACAICVALNNTVYKNNKKPEYYHPNCRCKVKKYDLQTVALDFPMKKNKGISICQ